MAFFPPIPLIRKKQIIKKLKEKNAYSEERAKTFEEAGIINPKAFKRITDKLVKNKIINKTDDNRYYLNK